MSIVGLAACSDATSPTMKSAQGLKLSATWVPSGSTVVVRPATLRGACQTAAAPFACYTAYPTGWLFYNDENDSGDPTLGSFVSGPGTPLYGVGSAQISVSGTQRRNLASYEFAGTPLSNITAMSFRTYNPSAGNGGLATRTAYLQFNVDFNGTDTWQRRLSFLPSDNGTVTQNSWKEWDAINGGNALWRYSGATWPVTGGPGTTPKTWNQILADYPGIRIRVTDAQLSMRVGEPYADGYMENIDSFTFGTAAGTTVYDFEPEPTTARGFKSAALTDLSGIVPSGSGDTDRRVNTAMTKIQSSLNRPNWTDDNRIDGNQANRVFTDERDAVVQLMGIKGTMPAGASQSITDLLAADRILTQTEINDNAGGNANKLATANREMATAQNEINKGHYQNAIDHYKNAWTSAHNA
jgi:hypothetical protein